MVSLVLAACGAARPVVSASRPAALEEAATLVTVRSPNWDASSGILERWERAETGWRRLADPVPVSLGRNGLAWGRGVHGDGAIDALGGGVKQEGDGRSPAGVFALSRVFGYSDEPPAGTTMSYSVITPSLQCVEDAASDRYNQILDRAEVTPSWSGTDLMRREDGLYEYVVVVEHNTTSPTSGAGSCVFFHIWRGEGTPTSGCTAMSRDALASLIPALSGPSTLLVQLPDAAYSSLAEAWGLPTVSEIGR